MKNATLRSGVYAQDLKKRNRITRLHLFNHNLECSKCEGLKAWLFSKWCSKYLSVTTSIYIYMYFIMRMCLVRNNYCYSYNRWETPNIYIGTWELCKLIHTYIIHLHNDFIYIYNQWKFQAIFSGDIPWNLGLKKKALYMVGTSKKSLPVAWPLLVGGIPTPLKNDGLRQLGWWHSIPNCFWKVIIQMVQSPPTSIYNYL